jgi:D-amino-acid dehydrogenase
MKPVIVVGAGVVGLACAVQLQRAGHQVVLIDRGEPGRECSFGNAGAFAVSDVIPLAEPGLWRKLPGWMFDPLGPLALRWRYLPSLAPWLWRFALASRPARVAALTRALAALLRRVNDDSAELIAHAGLEAMWRRHGALTLYRDEKEFSAAAGAWESRRRHGVDWRKLDAAELRAREPLLQDEWRCGIEVEAWSHVDDPYLFCHGLFATFVHNGGQFLCDEVSNVALAEGRAVGVDTARSGRVDGSGVVIAAGSWSDRFLRQLPCRVPLESERGYHVTLPRAGIHLHRFIQCASESFVILPMSDGGLRLAGTVELAHRDAPPDWARAHILLDKARRIVGPFGTESMSVWMGQRPSLPDTLPAIGPAPGIGQLFFAVGHGHLGLTLAATTGSLIADLVAGRDSGFDLTPCRLDRF